jgi:hypothetical protein
MGKLTKGKKTHNFELSITHIQIESITAWASVVGTTVIIIIIIITIIIIINCNCVVNRWQ